MVCIAQLPFDKAKIKFVSVRNDDNIILNVLKKSGQHFDIFKSMFIFYRTCLS